MWLTSSDIKLRITYKGVESRVECENNNNITKKDNIQWQVISLNYLLTSDYHPVIIGTAKDVGTSTIWSLLFTSTCVMKNYYWIIIICTDIVYVSQKLPHMHELVMITCNFVIIFHHVWFTWLCKAPTL